MLLQEQPPEVFCKKIKASVTNILTLSQVLLSIERNITMLDKSFDGYSQKVISGGVTVLCLFVTTSSLEIFQILSHSASRETISLLYKLCYTRYEIPFYLW